LLPLIEEGPLPSEGMRARPSGEGRGWRDGAQWWRSTLEGGGRGCVCTVWGVNGHTMQDGGWVVGPTGTRSAGKIWVPTLNWRVSISSWLPKWTSYPQSE